MPTVEDLGRRMKTKSGGAYDDLSDAEVGRMVKAKAPGKYDDFEDTSLTVFEHGQLSSIQSSVSIPDNQIEKIKEYYKPSKGRFTSWWQQRKSESRSQLLRTLNAEQLLIIEQGAIHERAVKDGKKSEAEFRVFIAQYAAQLLNIQHQARLIESAMANNLSVDNDQQLRMADGFSVIANNDADKQSQRDLKMSQSLSNLKVTEHKQIEEINLNNKILEKQEVVRLAIINKHLSEIQKMRLVQEQIDDINQQIDEIENNRQFSNRLKQRMIEDREEMIITLKENRRARARLLEANNAGTIQGLDVDAEL
jgi:ribosomal protein L30E